MLSPDEAKQRTTRHFKRWYQCWAGVLFCKAAGFRVAVDERTVRSQSLVVALNPPTEKVVLSDIPAAKAWAESWKTSTLTPWVVSKERNWASVGRQQIPMKLSLPNVSAIAECAEEASFWQLVETRTLTLATKWVMHWKDNRSVCASLDPAVMNRAIQKSAAKYAALSHNDWERLLATLDWLMENPGETCYIRQLPIRGIDSKWIELNKGAALPLYTAMTGEPNFVFAEISRQIRVRFLDSKLSPGGLSDISASPEELQKLGMFKVRPELVIVTENLVSLCCLPDMLGVLALHGGGYAVDALSRITWLHDVPILYWGDLDSNGFAILDRMRHYFPHVESLMMDEETLQQHKELCVREPSPNRGSFTCLNPEEQRVLDTLRLGEYALRLEQERVEWGYALQQIKKAVAKTGR